MYAVDVLEANITEGNRFAGLHVVLSELQTLSSLSFARVLNILKSNGRPICEKLDRLRPLRDMLLAGLDRYAS